MVGVVIHLDENNTLLPVYDYKYMVKKINEAYTS
jgi:hypothetical protein